MFSLQTNAKLTRLCRYSRPSTGGQSKTRPVSLRWEPLHGTNPSALCMTSGLLDKRFRSMSKSPSLASLCGKEDTHCIFQTSTPNTGKVTVANGQGDRKSLYQASVDARHSRLGWCVSGVMHQALYYLGSLCRWSGRAGRVHQRVQLYKQRGRDS